MDSTSLEEYLCENKGNKELITYILALMRKQWRRGEERCYEVKKNCRKEDHLSISCNKIEIKRGSIMT